jgi:hypothetical protein
MIVLVSSTVKGYPLPRQPRKNRYNIDGHPSPAAICERWTLSVMATFTGNPLYTRRVTPGFRRTKTRRNTWFLWEKEAFKT